MKKLFFIAAIAGAALVSCTKNELAPSVTAQEEISFAAPVVGAQTKVVNGAIGATYNTGESFDVWSIWHKDTFTAWDGQPLYINDKAAEYDSSKGGWAFNPVYYWPAEGYLSFVAVSPSIDNTVTYSDTYGFKIADWSQGADQDKIVDLMYSSPSLNHQKATYTSGDNAGEDAIYTYKGVDIKFNHALSYLVFTIKTADPYSTNTFQLKKITLSGIYTTGSFTQKPSGTDPNWAVNTSGSTGTYVAYTGTLPFDDAEAAAPAATGKEIILLPQTLVDGKQKLTIDYQIKADGGWIDQKQEVYLESGSIKAWQMGKKYTYNLSVSMTEIILDPAVEGWADGGSVDL